MAFEPQIEELFDVVDEHDVVLEQRPRSDVHRRRLLHRAVHVFLFRSDGRLLIHRRSAAKEEFPSVWTSSCSGHVSAGESYDETAPRELFEELGITATVERLQKFAACAETSFEFTMLYRAESDQVVVPDAGEIDAIEWVEIAELKRRTESSPGDFSPALLLLFRWFIVDFRSAKERGFRRAKGDNVGLIHLSSQYDI